VCPAKVGDACAEMRVNEHVAAVVGSSRVAPGVLAEDQALALGSAAGPRRARFSRTLYPWSVLVLENTPEVMAEGLPGRTQQRKCHGIETDLCDIVVRQVRNPRSSKINMSRGMRPYTTHVGSHLRLHFLKFGCICTALVQIN
jgi:hypothetical protein